MSTAVPTYKEPAVLELNLILEDVRGNLKTNFLQVGRRTPVAWF